MSHARARQRFQSDAAAAGTVGALDGPGARAPTLLGSLACAASGYRSLAALALASTLAPSRNWIVTGNPVYAFFYKIRAAAHINPAIDGSRRQANAKANGAGIGSLGATLGARLRATWASSSAHSATGRFWTRPIRPVPLVMGFALGGALVWLGRLVRRAVGRAPLGTSANRSRRASGWSSPRSPSPLRVSLRARAVLSLPDHLRFFPAWRCSPRWAVPYLAAAPLGLANSARWRSGSADAGGGFGLMGFKLFGPIELPAASPNRPTPS